MAGTKITGLTAGTPKLSDLFVAVDTTDPTMALSGTDKKYLSSDIKAFFFSTLGTMSTQNANAVAITGGAIDGTTIGLTTPSTGKFAGLTESTFATAGVVHNNASGLFSSSLIVTADITANTITNAKLAQMATLTIKGNNTGGASDPLDLTVAQVKTMLGLSGGITIADTQVGFGDSGNNLVGSANLTYNSSTGLLNIGGGTPDSTALLQLSSTTKTLKPPRMTTAQRTAISPSSGGGIVYDTDLNQWCGWNGSSWSVLG